MNEDERVEYLKVAMGLKESRSFGFTEADKYRMKEEMRLEGYDLTAGRIRAQVIAEAKFAGPVFMVQVGQIDQREWGKFRWHP